MSSSDRRSSPRFLSARALYREVVECVESSGHTARAAAAPPGRAWSLRPFVTVESPPCHLVKRHTGGVVSVVFSPDDHRLASGARDYTGRSGTPRRCRRSLDRKGDRRSEPLRMPAVGAARTRRLVLGHGLREAMVCRPVVDTSDAPTGSAVRTETLYRQEFCVQHGDTAAGGNEHPLLASGARRSNVPRFTSTAKTDTAPGFCFPPGPPAGRALRSRCAL